MTLAYAFDPYAAARVAREIDLIKAANPGCYTLAGVPYVVVQTPTGIVLQKAGRQKVAPGQMSLFGAPSQPASPKMSNVGRTKMVDGITYKLNQNSRWERTDKGQAAAAKPALAVLRDEPAAAPVVPPMAEAEPAGGDDEPDNAPGLVLWAYDKIPKKLNEMRLSGDERNKVKAQLYDRVNAALLDNPKDVDGTKAAIKAIFAENDAPSASGDDAPSPYHAAMPEAEPVGEKEKPSYENMVLEAEVFRYLTAKASEKYDDSSVLRAIGDLNTRSGRDKYLMDKYGIDQSEARSATNAAESLPRLFTIGGGEVTWQNNQAAKVGIDSAPQIEDYPDIQAIVEEAVATGEAMSRARAEATAANNAKPGQADLAKIPPGIASKLRASFGTVKAWNQRVNLARQTDRQFQGGGRYTWEATNGTQMEEPETLQIFRKMAPKNGIDADAALAAMGYEPPTQLMPSETNWRFASESNAAQQNAMPEPASDRPMAMPEAEPAAAAEPAGGEGAEGEPPELTWEDIPALWEAEDLDGVAFILDQNPRAMDYSATSRVLSILGISASKKKKILGKGYEAQFKKLYPNGSWYRNDYDIKMLHDTITAVGASDKKQSQKNAAVTKAIKEAKAAIAAGTATDLQEQIANLDAYRRMLLGESDRLRSKADLIDAEFSVARDLGVLRSPAEAMTATGAGAKSHRKWAHANRKEAQEVKNKIADLLPRPMSKTLSLGGARYILDGNILRKTSMEWEDFKPEAEAMHKEAQGDEAKGEDDPCWKGYKAVGLKRKGKRMVPNCVPV